MNTTVDNKSNLREMVNHAKNGYMKGALDINKSLMPTPRS